MRTTQFLLALLLMAGPPLVAQTLYVSPDVPTDPALGSDFLPWEVAEHGPAGWTAASVLTLAGDPAIDALHKMDAKDQWLISVESPNDFAGGLSTAAEPRDVILYDAGAGTFTQFFCGGTVAAFVAIGITVDAVYLDPNTGGDSGDLILSFDSPVELPVGSGTIYEPSDLVRYTPSGGVGCTAWNLVGIEFDASATGAPWTPDSSAVNVTGADFSGGRYQLAVDIPADLRPPAIPPTYRPGEIAAWDGVGFQLFTPLTNWPLSSGVDGLSCEANPGSVYDSTTHPVGLLVDRNFGLLLDLSWPGGGCSSGSTDYAIYEGTLASVRSGVYDHTRIVCTDALDDLQEQVAGLPADSYYLVVAHNDKDEGSYGTDSSGAERPVGAVQCVPSQVVTACP